MAFPRLGFNVPWFMFDINNFQLITSAVIPGDIRDQKSVVLTETPIPGLNYRPVTAGGGGNRKLSFTLPVIKTNQALGNIAMLKQIDRLRNRATGFGQWQSLQFAATPKVLYYWGTGSVPLVYWVAKADATHKAGWINQFGAPQVSEIEFELILDESDPVYQAEEMYRVAVSLFGNLSVAEIVVQQAMGARSY